VLLRYLAERYKMSDLYTEQGAPDSVIAEVVVTESADGQLHTVTRAPKGDESHKS
jgi:hypothetical protein